ncbi:MULTISPECIES: hypothetical protein [Streptomyces]|uniref:hypothetical protein n=1 Tax=Streptomyces TaxID=1883 RepID=UPI000978E51B|nr:MULTISPECIES: hypothetical protein [unclassified Streptomyces]ONI51725.1 hypothetical protein STIB_39450 [Streptomyces sp. IB2014 011-1]RDV49835.1 hypothetical protein DDV98_22285 [Streptomyces sp. IB2014 011-12]
MTEAVLIALAALIALTVVCLIGLLVHGRIAGQAMRRARTEDLPQMLEASGHTLVDLFSSLRFRTRRMLPRADTVRRDTGRSVGFDTLPGSERPTAEESER